MATQTAIVPSTNVSGNIGSCQVNSQDITINNFYTRTIAVNSCTGVIVSDNTYFQWGYIYVPSFIVISIVIFIGLINAISKY